MMVDFAKLKEPFPTAVVHWRVGSTNRDKTKGLALAYIDARAVMDRLDDVCGPANWQTTIEAQGSRVICALAIRAGDEWVIKQDGAGGTDHEPEKGGISDAFKRAAVHWGIGRYLYRLPAVWVEIEQRGKSYVIAKHEVQRLQKLLPGSNVEAAPTANGHAEPAQKPQPAMVELWKSPNDRMTTTVKEAAMWLGTNIPAVQSTGRLNAIVEHNGHLLQAIEQWNPAWHDRIRKLIAATLERLDEPSTDFDGMEEPEWQEAEPVS